MADLKLCVVALIAILAMLTVAVDGLAQAPARSAAKMKIILDTDLGDDIDDIYALALLTTRPDVELLGVTTAWGQTHERAELAAKFLKLIGRSDVPVYAGRRGEAKIRDQYLAAKG